MQNLYKRLIDLSHSQERLALKLTEASEKLKDNGLLRLSIEAYKCADSLKVLADEFKGTL